jgi:hypothetical protein
VNQLQTVLHKREVLSRLNIWGFCNVKNHDWTLLVWTYSITYLHTVHQPLLMPPDLILQLHLIWRVHNSSNESTTSTFKPSNHCKSRQSSSTYHLIEANATISLSSLNLLNPCIEQYHALLMYLSWYCNWQRVTMPRDVALIKAISPSLVRNSWHIDWSRCPRQWSVFE